MSCSKLQIEKTPIAESIAAAIAFAKQPITIAGHNFPSRLFCAPLAGITTLPMRQLLRKTGPVVLFTDMIPVHLVIFNREKLREMIDPTKEDTTHLIVQISGSQERIIAEAVSVLRDLGVKTLNLNMGCPVRKVTGGGSGAALLKSPPTVTKLFETLSKFDDLIITAKIRAGWDDRSINCFEMGTLLQELGVKAIFLHPRTAKQDYGTPARWELVQELKARLSIPVIGNGDVFAPEDAVVHLRPDVCDGVMIGRGILGNPWIFSDIFNYDQARPRPAQTERKINTMLEHLELQCAHYGEGRGVRSFRKLGLKYIAGIPHTKPLKERFLKLTTCREIESLCKELLPSGC